MSESRSRDFLKYQQMATEELEEILRLDAEAPEGEESDIELILYVMEVLADRKRNSDDPGKTAQQAYESFKEHYLPEDKERKTAPKVKTLHWLSLAASAAVVVCIFSAVVPKKAEAEGFWEWLTRWTSDIVEFLSPNDNEGRHLVYEFKTDNAGLQELYDAVVEMGVTDPVVPMWLPEGSELLGLEWVSTSQKNGILATFSVDDGELLYQIDYYNTEYLHTYQKIEQNVREFEFAGITHSVVNNNEGLVVIWNRDNVECFITVDCQEDTLNKILESIYVMEDNK